MLYTLVSLSSMISEYRLTWNTTVSTKYFLSDKPEYIISMIQASRYYKMYWNWIIFTGPNKYLLDRGLGLVVKGTGWHKQWISHENGSGRKMKDWKYVSDKDVGTMH